MCDAPTRKSTTRRGGLLHVDEILELTFDESSAGQQVAVLVVDDTDGEVVVFVMKVRTSAEPSSAPRNERFRSSSMRISVGMLISS